MINVYIIIVYYRLMVICNDICIVYIFKSEIYLVYVIRYIVNGNLWFWVGGIFYLDV